MVAFAAVAGLYAVWLPASCARRIPDVPHHGFHDAGDDEPPGKS
jgi:hypothetical protein